MTDTHFDTRRFQASEVPGFDAGYYLKNNPDVLESYNKWSNDLSSMHYADYIRTNQDLAGAWNDSAWTGGDQSQRLSRWDRGSWHWDNHGKNEPGRLRPLVVGDRSSIPGETRTIWTGRDPFTEKDYGDESRNDFAAWHFDTYGRNEPGRFANYNDWYYSAGQDQIRQDAAAEVQADHNTTMEGIAQQELEILSRPTTIQRSGSPGAVGKPAAGMKIAKGDDYSGGRRGTSKLNRDSAYFINNLGGVNSSNTNNMRIT